MRPERSARRSAPLAVLAASALILGLLGMHVLIGGLTPMPADHSGGSSNTVMTVDSSAHHQVAPIDSAPTAGDGCDMACQAGHAMPVIGCILALFVTGLIMSALPRIIGLQRRRHPARRLVLGWALAAPPVSPPDLNVLSICRT